MRTLLIIILIVSILGNFVGLFFAYKWYKQRSQLHHLRNQVRVRSRIIAEFGSRMDRQLVFLHHSVGSIWLDQGELRATLLKHGIGVHDATYGDEISDQTDVRHWVPKFRKSMDKILTFNYSPNVYYEDGRENDIVMFKSCFPNSDITTEGNAPGDPTGRERSTWNYRAVFAELQEIFSKHPGKAFIYVTAPPLEPGSTTPENAARARAFNTWLVSEFEQEYRQQTGQENFHIFDLFAVLADQDNYLAESYRLGSYKGDSHPNGQGTRAATDAFVQFLIQRGLLQPSETDSVPQPEKA